MSDEMDNRKLSLDERRLDFEITKYESEREQREIDLERSREELSALKRPFYKNPSYLGPLATICVAALGGFFAFGTNFLNSNVVKLSTERSELTTAKDRLSKVNEVLSRDHEALTSTNSNLNAKNEELQGTNGHLEEEMGSLATRIRSATDQVEKEHSEITALSAQRTELQRLIPIEREQAALQILEDESKNTPVTQENPSFKILLSVATSTRDPESTSLIEKAHGEKQTSGYLKPALAFAMYRATHLEGWKESLRDDAMQQVKQILGRDTLDYPDVSKALGLLTWLRDDTIFNLNERRQFFDAVLALVGKGASDEDNGKNYRLVESRMVNWDADVSAIERTPWITVWNSLSLQVTPEEKYRLSPQGLAIGLMTEMAVTPAKPYRPEGSLFLQDGRRFLGVPAAFKEICTQNAEIPICTDLKAWNGTDQLLIPSSRVGAIIMWLKEHPKATLLFSGYSVSDASFNHASNFKVLPDAVFRDIVLKKWIAEDRIPD